MKAAAAVLAGSLLFFLGVLTGAGRQESVPAPGPIPLGVANQAAPENPPSAPPEVPTATTGPAVEIPAAPTSPASTSPTSTARPPRPQGPPDSAGSGTSTTRTSDTAATTATTGPPTTATPAVEEVDGEVECTSPGRGRGRQPCPPTTAAATGDERGGGRDH